MVATVKIAAGSVSGVVDQGVQAFKGVPYAAPPVGEHWLRPPRHRLHGTVSAMRRTSAPWPGNIRCPGSSASLGHRRTPPATIAST